MTWRGGPERYIGSSGSTPRWFSTTSVFVSLMPKRRPWSRAKASSSSMSLNARGSWRGRPRRRRGRAGPRRSRARSCRMPATRSRPSRVGLSLTTTSRPCRVIRCLAIAPISSGGQPWKVESVTEPDQAGRERMIPPGGERLGDLQRAVARSVAPRVHDAVDVGGHRGATRCRPGRSRPRGRRCGPRDRARGRASARPSRAGSR